MTNNYNNRVMLDAIHQAIKDKFIPENQLDMVANNTNGRHGMMSCHICASKGEEILLMAFDQEGDNCKLFPYFQEKPGLVSMCDYILFVEDNDKVFVFVIEMKDSSHRSKKQAMMSQPFAEFLVNRIKATSDKHRFSKPVEYRKIGIKSGCSKMTTKGYDTSSYDEDGFTVLLDHHKFYIRRLKELPSK